MAAAGVRHLTVTPHFDALLTLDAGAAATRLDALDRGWSELASLAHESFPTLALSRGAEVMLDVPRPDLGDPRLRLGGGTFVLVEFAYHAVPPESAASLSYLRGKGWIPLLAHPERYSEVRVRPRLLAEWRRAGAYFQMNSGSLTGGYGKDAQRVANDLLARGWADVLASDYHGRGSPGLTEAWRLLEEAGGCRRAELRRPWSAR